MPQAKKAKHTWVLVGVVGGTAAVAAAVQMALPAVTPMVAGIRFLALTGYLLIFCSIVSSAYMVELVQFFGRPFVRIHHVVSITGLALVTLHPMLVAVQSQSLGVFLPRFDSVRVFLQLGGRPAWYLIAVAVVAAFLRQRIGASWRTVHTLNYAAFALATAHANLLGGNFQWPLLRFVSWVLLGAALGVWIRRRLRARPARGRQS